MKNFRDKCVVITGAGSGIGRALAIEFARHEARLALCDLNQIGLAETIEQVGNKTHIVADTVDVSQEESVLNFAKLVQNRCGGADVLVNNAGVSLTQVAEKMSKADLEWVFGVNFWGVIHGCHAFLPQLMQKSESHIANVSSLFGLIPMPSNAAYVASKFAVRGYTETLRIELAHTQVKVSCIHPGGVKTDIVRNGRHYKTEFTPVDTRAFVDFFEKRALTTPESAARAIVRGVKRNQPRIIVGPDAAFADLIQRISPRGLSQLLILLSQKIAEKYTAKTRNQSNHGQAA